MAVSIEADINELETFEERQIFLEDLGLSAPGSAKLFKKAYALLKQQTYFTAGEKEVRAWTFLLEQLLHKQRELFTPTLKKALFALKSSPLKITKTTVPKIKSKKPGKCVSKEKNTPFKMVM